jgi:hypothetical protein
MGSGSWNTRSYASYCCSVGHGYDTNTCTLKSDYACSSQAFKSYELDKAMNPKNVIRECCDSDEHPTTIPIILALDVTGSMGSTAIEVQKKLNPIMVEIYKRVKDAEIMVMAIGDLAYDISPIQISQFESDIRIAENLDKIYFENGGGGNDYESYTAAWYIGLKHCKLDCWKRGKKGLIITMGDEPINPYLPCEQLNEVTRDTCQKNVETPALFKEASEKFDIYHISVESVSYPDQARERGTFAKVIGEQHALVSSVDKISDKIINIVEDFAKKSNQTVFLESPKTSNGDAEISW